MRTNVMGTRVMVEAAKTAGVPTFLHTSSIAAVGYSADGVPIDEDAPYNFADLHLLYNDSKREAEAEVLDAQRYGVRVVIVNPGVLYGPRSLSHPFGHTMLELAAGRIPGHPSGGISVTDVQDAARGIAAALERGRTGERYLLTGHNITYGELFRRQAMLVGAAYNGRPLPGYALTAAARLFELRSRFTGVEPRLTIDNAKIGALFMYYTSSKAAAELGYSNQPVDATLERMFDEYKKAGALP
jgi:dihydroflavonol-4-reductase